jgi:Domain of unknown function (DUF4440)
VADEEKSLVELDKAMFAAEAHDPEDGWIDLLQRSLSDDFRLRRAIGEIEDRERMITRLSRSAPVQRVLLDEPAVALLGDVAVVRSRLRVPAGTFANTKLFEKTSGEWRCVYWRVVREAET